VNAFGTSALAVAGGLVGVALGDLLSEEIRARLEKVPHAILRLAALRVPVALRRWLREEWSAELAEILSGRATLPLTRLWVGLRYALGLLRTSPEVGRALAPRIDAPVGGVEHGRQLSPWPDAAGFAGSLAFPRAAQLRALAEISSFIRADASTGGMLVLTGSPGSGRSVVLAQIAAEANRPGSAAARQGVIALRAAGMDAHRVGREIARAAGLRMPRRLEDLAPALAAALRAGDVGERVLILDALDEAERPAEILDRVLVPVAQACAAAGLRTVVGTRRLLPGRLAALAPTVVDLDRWTEQGGSR
jgi:hypothetical protein